MPNCGRHSQTGVLGSSKSSPQTLPPLPGQPSRESALLGLQSRPPLLPPGTGTLGREGWRERRFGKISGLASFGDADNHPPPSTPRLVPGGAASLRPRAARPAPSSRGQEPWPSGRACRGPGSGVCCSWQCGGRGADGRRGRLLITRPPSPGSRSHGQPGAPAWRERHRPGREVGQSRARVAGPCGKGVLDGFPSPTRQHLWWV